MILSDLIMCYKILNNQVCVDADTFFTRCIVNLTRGHCAKLNKSRTVSVRDGNFFSNRVINAVVVSSCSVASFKRRLQFLDFSLD